jgi:hypothetical protein
MCLSCDTKIHGFYNPLSQLGLIKGKSPPSGSNIAPPSTGLPVTARLSMSPSSTANLTFTLVGSICLASSSNGTKI